MSGTAQRYSPPAPTRSTTTVGRCTARFSREVTMKVTIFRTKFSMFRLFRAESGLFWRSLHRRGVPSHARAAGKMMNLTAQMFISHWNVWILYLKCSILFWKCWTLPAPLRVRRKLRHCSLGAIFKMIFIEFSLVFHWFSLVFHWFFIGFSLILHWFFIDFPVNPR